MGMDYLYMVYRMLGFEDELGLLAPVIGFSKTFLNVYFLWLSV